MPRVARRPAGRCAATRRDRRRRTGPARGSRGRDAQDVGARPSGRDRATSVLDGRAHVTALDHRRTGDLDDRLDVRRPQRRALPPRTLRHRQQPLEPRPPGARAAPQPAPRLPAAKGARAAARREASAPSQETVQPARSRRTHGRSRRAVRRRSRHPRRGGVIDRVLHEPVRSDTKPPHGGAARARPHARARAARTRRTDGDSDTTARARPGRPGTYLNARARPERRPSPSGRGPRRTAQG